MEFLYILTTSNVDNIANEKPLGVFEDVELARQAGQWWSNYHGHDEDIWWSSTENLETAQAGPKTWLHIRTCGMNKLLEVNNER